MLASGRLKIVNSSVLALFLSITLAGCSGEGIIEEVDLGRTGDDVTGTGDAKDPVDDVGPDAVEEDAVTGPPDANPDDTADADVWLEEDLQNDVSIGPAAPVGTCALTEAWAEGAQPYGMHYADTYLHKSPDGLTWVAQSSMSREFFDPASGALLTQDGYGDTAFAEGNWSVSLSLTPDDLLLTAAGASVPTLALPLPWIDGMDVEWMAGGRVGLNPDSTWAAAAVCWRGKEGSSHALLGVYSMESSTLSKVVDLQQQCGGAYWQERPLIEFAGPYVVVRMPETGVVHAVHLTELEHFRADLALGLSPAPYLADPVIGYVPVSPPVVRFAVSGDLRQLAVVTYDARIRFYLLPQLEPVGPTIETALAGVNMATYGPTIASPLAWSQDGTVIAHLSVAGGLALSDARNGQLLSSYPNLLAQPLPELPISLNPATAIRILDGDKGIVVLHEWGRRRLDCP